MPTKRPSTRITLFWTSDVEFIQYVAEFLRQRYSGYELEPIVARSSTGKLLELQLDRADLEHFEFIEGDGDDGIYKQIRAELSAFQWGWWRHMDFAENRKASIDIYA